MNTSSIFLTGLLALGLASDAVAQQPANPKPISQLAKAKAIDILQEDVGKKDPFLGKWKKIQRSRAVKVDFAALHRALPNDVLRLEVFKDRVHRARVLRRDPIHALEGAFHLHCQLEGYAFSHCILTVVGDGFAGWIYTGDHRHHDIVIQGAPGMHCVRVMTDGGKGCACGEGQVRTKEVEPKNNFGACNESFKVITIMMLYDKKASTQAGGSTKIKATMANALAQLNTVMKLSGLGDTQFQATSIKYANYDGGFTMSTELGYLRYTKGQKRCDKNGQNCTVPDPYGYLDFVHGWRKTEGADLVALIVGDLSIHGNTLGIANRPHGQPGSSQAFSVTEWNSANNYTFAHEIGHNFACAHDRAQYPKGTTTVYTYSYGYTKEYYSSYPTKKYFYTVMAYKPSIPFGWFGSTARAPVFSDPNLKLQTSNGTFPAGVAGLKPTRNALTIKNTRQSVANHSYNSGYQTPPRITRQPNPTTVCSGRNSPRVLTRVEAIDANKYQWELYDNGWKAITGQTSSSLWVWTSNFTKTVAVRCKLTGPCSSVAVYSASASITVKSCRVGAWAASKTGTQFGAGIAPVGDFNGDGYKDFAIGEPRGSAVHVVSGKDHKYLKSGGWSGLGAWLLGESLAAGDLDGDNRPDVLATGIYASGGKQYAGVYWISSKDKGFRLFWSGPYVYGSQLEAAQYLDPDGVWDVLVTLGNTLYAISGKTKKQLWKVTAPARIDGMATLGDINRDGYDDVLLGEPTYTANASRGRIEIRSGKDGTVLRAVNGPSSTYRFGYAVAAFGGDLTFDGVPDYATSEWGPIKSPYKYGIVSFWDGASGRLIGRVTQPQSASLYGASLSSTGDANGDGWADLLIGATNEQQKENGYIHLVSGRLGKTIRIRSEAGAYFGRKVVSLDLNGDGRVDDIANWVGNTNLGAVKAWDAQPKANPPHLLHFGMACVDSKGRIPRASHSPEPRVNTPTKINLDSAPPNALTFVHVGGGAPRAIDLGVINMPGCVWYVDPIHNFSATTNFQGSLRLTSQVPNSSGLVGLVLKLQFFSVDLGLPRSRLQIVASHAAQIKIGAR